MKQKYTRKLLFYWRNLNLGSWFRILLAFSVQKISRRKNKNIVFNKRDCGKVMGSNIIS